MFANKNPATSKRTSCTCTASTHQRNPVRRILCQKDATSHKWNFLSNSRLKRILFVSERIFLHQTLFFCDKLHLNMQPNNSICLKKICKWFKTKQIRARCFCFKATFPLSGKLNIIYLLK